MKWIKDVAAKNEIARCRSTWKKLGILLITLSFYALAQAQQTQLVQVKTFNEKLEPLRNVEVAINQREYIVIGNKGVSFIQLPDSEFPLKSIKVKDDKLETASWNYSKGTLEIIIRAKSYHVVPVIVRDQSNAVLRDVKITFKGKKTTTLTTNSDGRVDLPLALDEKISSHEQFSLTNFESVKFISDGGQTFLTVKSISENKPAKEKVAQKTTDYFKDFDLSKLDSIQSLTVFYAIFKNYQIKDMSPEIRRRVDQKFNQLVAELQDSVRHGGLKFVGKISDSSYVSDDVQNLLSRAEQENQTLEMQRNDFDTNIQIIKEKLESGVSNLKPAERGKLLSDLTKLESLLVQNEGKFYKNQNDYRSIVNSLKEKYFDVTDLENKLFVSESQRLEEQREFRQKLYVTLSVLFVFAVLILLLIYFSDKLKKQKKELVRVNEEINRMNENLEGLVAERTKLLEEANKELDTFLYRASHDLRSPVCSIIGLCNIALHMSNGESKDLVERVVITTTTMDKLLKKLSIISEINQPTNFSSITLLDSIENVQRSFAKVIKEQNITFSVDCPADLVIFSYPNLVETILSNLIENAFFYSVMRDAKNAQVELTASVKDDYVEISVYDNGIGVGEDISHRLFDMFFKGHEYSKGNGLGLYIVQKSVQALEGKIEVESVVGSFTRFIVQLPLKPVAFEAITVDQKLELPVDIFHQ
jgi:signal transduction histidine kinase